MLFLVRDPQGVVASFDRDDVPEPRFRESKTNAYLWLTYALSLWVFLRQPRTRRMLVRHEDVLADPEGVLGSILVLAGSRAALPDLGRSERRRARYRGTAAGKRDDRRCAAPARAEKRPRKPLTAVLQAPWSAIFALLRPAARARTFSLSTAGIVTSMDAPADQGISGASEGAESAAEPVKVLFLMGSGTAAARSSASRSATATASSTPGSSTTGSCAREPRYSEAPSEPASGTRCAMAWRGPKRRSEPTHSATSNDPRRSCARAAAIREHLRQSWGPVTESLYRSIAHAAGASQIVDSAHFPLRARELARLEGVELYLLFLVRDPQQVVHSFVKHVNRHAVAERRWRTLVTNMDMSLTYLLGTLVFLGHPRERRALLRHEDFLEDPEGVLRAIFALTGSHAQPPDLATTADRLSDAGEQADQIRNGLLRRQARARRAPPA